MKVTPNIVREHMIKSLIVNRRFLPQPVQQNVTIEQASWCIWLANLAGEVSCKESAWLHGTVGYHGGTKTVMQKQAATQYDHAEPTAIRLAAAAPPCGGGKLSCGAPGTAHPAAAGSGPPHCGDSP